MTPTLATACAALPPEGAVSPGGGPAAKRAPTLAAACAALPPEGAVSPGGGPAAKPAPTLAGSRGQLSPALNFATELLLAARGIKVAFFDVDGVLTDGGLLLSEQGETLKRFNILDGLGLKLLQKGGITPVVITGRDSRPLRGRLSALGVTHVHFETDDKGGAAEQSLRALGLNWAQAAGIGDDWPDLAVLQRCAFAAAPPHAHCEVKAVANYVTVAAGGHGAAREFCDLLLVANGRYAQLLVEFGDCG